MIPGESAPIGIYSYPVDKRDKCWGRCYAVVTRVIPGIVAKLMLVLSVPPQPQCLRNGQWRSDHAVVTGFIIEIFRAQAVASDDRILDLERIYDGYPQPTEMASGSANMVVGCPTRNLVETVRRAAEDQTPCPKPPAELLDPSVFPVEMPEAAQYPVHDSVQRLLGEAPRSSGTSLTTRAGPSRPTCHRARSASFHRLETSLSI